MPNEEENEKVNEMLEQAQAFLFRCRDGDGVFCLREFRRRKADKSSPAGKMMWLQRIPSRSKDPSNSAR